jgi:hypothetical protein
VTREKGRVTGLKESYIQRANSNVEAFSASIRGAMQGQASFLTQRLQQLNTSLSSLGIGSGIDASPLEAENLERDDDGLIRAPNNVLAHIGGSMSPPMLNLSGESFSGALGGLADGVREVDQNLSQAQNGPAQINALAARCSSERVNRLVESASSDADSLTGCDAVERCGNPSAVDRLTADISSLDSSIDVSALDSLSTGIQTNCSAGSSRRATVRDCSTVPEANRYQCNEDNRRDASASDTAATSRRCSQTVSRLQRKVRDIAAAQRAADGVAAEAAR